ncbi:hypothetical protein FRC08_003187 [Ceratobasidium sp. 394]|nr:hypothetical protein FRC08_003187 [Ceratobasidium sp. 394]
MGDIAIPRVPHAPPPKAPPCFAPPRDFCVSAPPTRVQIGYGRAEIGCGDCQSRAWVARAIGGVCAADLGIGAQGMAVRRVCRACG